MLASNVYVHGSLLFVFECTHIQLFRTMLQKKMNARPSNAAVSSRKYYLDDKPSGRMMTRDGRRRHDGEDDEKGSDRIKWDKTDTDCKNVFIRC